MKLWVLILLPATLARPQGDQTDGGAAEVVLSAANSSGSSKNATLPLEATAATEGSSVAPDLIEASEVELVSSTTLESTTLSAGESKEEAASSTIFPDVPSSEEVAATDISEQVETGEPDLQGESVTAAPISQLKDVKSGEHSAVEKADSVSENSSANLDSTLVESQTTPAVEQTEKQDDFLPSLEKGDDQEDFLPAVEQGEDLVDLDAGAFILPDIITEFDLVPEIVDGKQDQDDALIQESVKQLIENGLIEGGFQPITLVNQPFQPITEQNVIPQPITEQSQIIQPIIEQSQILEPIRKEITPLQPDFSQSEEEESPIQPFRPTGSTKTKSTLRIQNQPQSKEIFIPGSVFGLQCEATSKTDIDIQYSWTKNGRFIDLHSGRIFLESEKKGNLVILNPRDEDSGLYQCAASNTEGVVFSRVIMVESKLDVLKSGKQSTRGSGAARSINLSPELFLVLPHSNGKFSQENILIVESEPVITDL